MLFVDQAAAINEDKKVDRRLQPGTDSRIGDIEEECRQGRSLIMSFFCYMWLAIWRNHVIVINVELFFGPLCKDTIKSEIIFRGCISPCI
ncbi:hypothetical protein K0M31_012821 [Melipona bicolor]|uniref:Uncharacterized protein n=1 Tax=Melipona bicolor TaxID=60889 RepID=A0AA40FJ86_9HYME|nr:hypothetical protein K0M31_012821 [Melipona bicolor]